jgi:hypothetical protein
MPQVTPIKVTESDSYLTIRFNLLSDGSGELVNVPILAPADLVPPRKNNQPAFRILEAWYGMVWFDFTLSTGSLAPVDIWTFARDCDSHIDFRRFGGPIDQNVYASPPVVDDGVLMISTNGFVAGSRGSVILCLAKTNEKPSAL